MGFIIWTIAHLMLLKWLITASKKEKLFDISKAVSDFKEAPFMNFYLLTVIVAIEIFALGVVCPSLFVFHIVTPFGTHESWSVALIYVGIWYVVGFFSNKW